MQTLKVALTFYEKAVELIYILHNMGVLNVNLFICFLL